jgi:hypothetical protein
MVEILYKKGLKARAQKPFIGPQMLDIITSGMYDDPLMVYREYIQNSVDSIDMAAQGGKFHSGEGKISILISGTNRTVSIEDNGGGLSEADAKRVLLDLGCSPKDESRQRGFRGIGRLGGLAYCDLLRFETRSSDERNVTAVEWDKKRLDDLGKQVSRETSLVEIVKNITRIFVRKANENDPQHFFRVQMENVRKFHSDRLMNIKTLKEYLSQVAPVPYDKTVFSYAEKLDKYFAPIAGFRGYDLTINGEKILRPYSDIIQISSEPADQIKDIECFQFSTTDGKPLALGWYATTNFKASLPSQVTMRGIRVRLGNLEVGNEYFLSPFFAERRFSTWNIGEIHVWDHYIKPNARRDGFEHTPEYERFLEQASALGRHLSTLCRRYSIVRSAKQRFERKLEEMERLGDSMRFAVNDNEWQNIVFQAERELKKIKAFINDEDFYNRLTTEYAMLKYKLEKLKVRPPNLNECIDGRTLRYVEKKDLFIKILATIVREYDKTTSAEDLIRRILKQLGPSSK